MGNGRVTDFYCEAVRIFRWHSFVNEGLMTCPINNSINSKNISEKTMADLAKRMFNYDTYL